MSQKITTMVFTGGGTAGHVMPNVALIERFLEQPSVHVFYIGSKTGIEKKIIQDLGVSYFEIDTGKLRRYWTVQHFSEPFKILRGLWQAYRVLGTLKPDLVFSKGGFVSFPVVVMAWLRRIPVIVHESDLTPGLANRLVFPLVKKICVNFPQTVNFFKNKAQVYLTGTPIRKALLQGSKEEAYRLSGLNANKPVILVMGGSLGSQKINQVLRQALPLLLKDYQVLHICGSGNVATELQDCLGYGQFEFVGPELGHFFSIADIVISRSGANSLYELLTLAKPHILIPLSAAASRGDQIQNAEYFVRQGSSQMIMEQDLTVATLMSTIAALMLRREDVIQKMKGLGYASATDKVQDVIVSCL